MNYKSILCIVTLVCCNLIGKAQYQNDIIGKWTSIQKNVIVLIYNDSTGFKGKVLWFNDSDDESRPMNLRTDIKNPDKNLRNQKILGLDVLTQLDFDRDCKCWQNGKIYDVQSGKTWSASITMLNENLIKVRGFWHYEFFGRSILFRRIK